MDTISDLLVGAITYAPVPLFVTGSVTFWFIGIFMGGLIATILWFRWYIDGALGAITEVANYDRDTD